MKYVVRSLAKTYQEDKQCRKVTPTASYTHEYKAFATESTSRRLPAHENYKFLQSYTLTGLELVTIHFAVPKEFPNVM